MIDMPISWEGNCLQKYIMKKAISGRNYYNDNCDYPIRTIRGKKQLQPVEAILAKRSTGAIDTHLEMGVCD